MARPNLRSALEGAGFNLAESYSSGGGNRVGTVMTHHYTLTRPYGNTTVTHHVYVDEYGKNPGKPDVSYHVTHSGKPFSDGDYDTIRSHRSNNVGGVKDPIGEILAHHNRVNLALSSHEAPPLIGVTPKNIHEMNPDWLAHTHGRGLASEIHSGPNQTNRMQSLNSTHDRPLDAEVYRVLTSGTEGNRFIYQGRFPGDDGTDLYQVAHPDPASPHTFEYGFTVRHRPGSTQPFSYNAMRYQSGVGDNGEEDPGSFLDVTGNMDHVAKFGTLAQLVRRHGDILKALKIKSSGTRPRMSAVEKTADEFDNIIRGNNYVGSCDMCGKAVRDIPESSFRDDKLYQVEPRDEAPGLHGGPINLCGACSVDPDVTYNIRRNYRSFGWHHPGAKIGECSDCDREAMEDADEDLRP